MAAPAGVLADAPADPEVVPPPAGQLTAAAVRETWAEIVTMVGRRSKKIAALAHGATVRDLDGQTLVLTFRFPAHARMVADQPDAIVEALYETLGGRWQIRCEVAGDGGAAPRTSAPAQARPAPRPEPVQAPVATGTGDDWPEPARPGGVVAAPAEVRQSAPAAEEPPVTGRGMAAARAAMARTSAAGGAWSDGSPTEEAPYDPEYDGPAAKPAPAIEGFDPGDEPLDDVVDEKSSRHSSEQQAVQLLRDAFGAEKIGGDA